MGYLVMGRFGDRGAFGSAEADERFGTSRGGIFAHAIEEVMLTDGSSAGLSFAGIAGLTSLADSICVLMGPSFEPATPGVAGGTAAFAKDGGETPAAVLRISWFGAAKPTCLVL